MKENTPDRLNRLRLKKAIIPYTQSHLEQLSGLSYTTIWRFVTGRSNPTLDVYNKLIKLLTKLEGKDNETH